VWNSQPSFPRDTQISSALLSPLDFADQRDLLSPGDLFGFESPIVPIFHQLRTLSHSLSPSQILTTNRLLASYQIYDVEFSLLSSNQPDLKTKYLDSCLHLSGSLPLRTAIHVYLYLVIREISPGSELIVRLIDRLQGQIESHLEGWWAATSVRRTWLLWILFIGGAATKVKMHQRRWFVKELGVVCRNECLFDVGGLREALKQVVWQDEWCEKHCLSLWDDIQAQEGGFGNAFDTGIVELDCEY
jgi:hypothetical protein